MVESADPPASADPSSSIDGAQSSGGATTPVPIRQVLGPFQAAAVVVGMVVGAGVFRTASVAAQSLGSPEAVLAAWAAGGVFAVAGALCYAELATTFPSPGGDYRFLREAFGSTVAYLFAWSRFAVIFTASSALLAFVGADYLAQLVPMDGVRRGGVAALLILLLTLFNLRGVRTGVTGQLGLVVMDVGALLTLGGAGVWLWLHGGSPPPSAAPAPPTSPAGFGAAMVFVMLAYGGFNDAATLSAEVRRPRHMTLALGGGMALVTALYLLANWAYLQGLGVRGLAASDAPAAALMRRVFGPVGEAAIVALVGVTSLSSLNALVIVGGRTLYAVSAAEPGLARLAAWDTARGVPRLALWTQAAVSIALVAWGAWTRRGFAAMVDYMAPVYWLFLGLAGAALLVLRRTRASGTRPYRTPFAPLVAGGFTLGSACVLAASLRYVGWTGAALSFGVLLLGLVLRSVLDRAHRPGRRRRRR